MPTSAKSPARRQTFRRPAGIVLGASPGGSYRIDISTDLSTANGWTLLTNLALTASPVLVPDPLGPVISNRF